MKPAAQLHALIGSRTWDKELVMWVGSEKTLHQALGSAKCVVLDLLDLFDLGNLPADDESTRDQLRDRLRDKLRRRAPVPAEAGGSGDAGTGSTRRPGGTGRLIRGSSARPLPVVLERTSMRASRRSITS